MTINCPKCGGDSGVFNTRGDGIITFRSRFCKCCGYTFKTFETVGDDIETVKRLTRLSKKKGA